jgi:hypothetical protein
MSAKKRAFEGGRGEQLVQSAVEFGDKVAREIATRARNIAIKIRPV